MELAWFLGIPESTLSNYVTGIRSFVQDFSPFEEAIRKLNSKLDWFSQSYLNELKEKADKYIKAGNLVGIITSCAHDGYEDITNIRMESVGIPSIHETELPNGRFPDTIIHRIQDGESELDSVFIREIEDKQSVIRKEELEGHQWILVDYTISPAKIEEKLTERGYATDDRFLIIVLYGQHSDNTIREAKGLVRGYDNAILLTELEYHEFLGLSQDGQISARYAQISLDTTFGFDRDLEVSDPAIDRLRDDRVQARLSLKAHKEKWYDYFKQRLRLIS